MSSDYQITQMQREIDDLRRENQIKDEKIAKARHLIMMLRTNNLSGRVNFWESLYAALDISKAEVKQNFSDARVRRRF